MDKGVTRKVEENQASRVFRKTREEGHLKNASVFNSAKCFRVAKAWSPGSGPLKNSGVIGDLVRGSFRGAEI